MSTTRPLRTASAKQAAALVLSMVSERDANKRAKYAHQVCQLLTDLDATATAAVGLAAISQQQEELLQAVEATGIRVIATDTETPLTLNALQEAA